MSSAVVFPLSPSGASPLLSSTSGEATGFSEQIDSLAGKAILTPSFVEGGAGNAQKLLPRRFDAQTLSGAHTPEKDKWQSATSANAQVVPLRPDGSKVIINRAVAQPTTLAPPDSKESTETPQSDTEQGAAQPAHASAVQTSAGKDVESKPAGESAPKQLRAAPGLPVMPAFIRAQVLVNPGTMAPDSETSIEAGKSLLPSGSGSPGQSAPILIPVSASVADNNVQPAITPGVKVLANAGTGEMAFAARIKPVESQNRQSGDALQHGSADDSMPAPRHNSGSNAPDAALHQTVSPAPIESAPPPITAQAVQAETPRIASTAVPLPPTPKAAAATVTEEAAPLKAAATNISLQVGSTKGEMVEVQLSQRSGELRVAVRTSDNDVAQGLRQGLSDLTTKLGESGYRADTWHPDDTSSLTFNAAKDASNSQGQSSGGGSEQQNQAGAQQQNTGRQNQNPSNRPRWVQELETNLHSGKKSQEN